MAEGWPSQPTIILGVAEEYWRRGPTMQLNECSEAKQMKYFLCLSYWNSHIRSLGVVIHTRVVAKVNWRTAEMSKYQNLYFWIILLGKDQDMPHGVNIPLHADSSWCFNSLAIPEQENIIAEPWCCNARTMDYIRPCMEREGTKAMMVEVPRDTIKDTKMARNTYVDRTGLETPKFKEQ
jgi:hypothetical protein